VLYIEYDVAPDGEVGLVALVNAVDEDGHDADGSAWMSWRRAEFDDDGWGCAAVPPEALAQMEGTDDVAALRDLVEQLVLADRAAKEAAP
jgi:hypothetical protein